MAATVFHQITSFIISFLVCATPLFVAAQTTTPSTDLQMLINQLLARVLGPTRIQADLQEHINIIFYIVYDILGFYPKGDSKLLNHKAAFDKVVGI